MVDLLTSLGMQVFAVAFVGGFFGVLAGIWVAMAIVRAVFIG